MTNLVLAVLLLATSANAPEVTAGKPLRDVTVKVARYSGHQFAASGSVSSFRGDGKINASDPAWSKRTDADGRFDFGVLPKGKYAITLEMPPDSPPLALLTLKRAAAEPVKEVWDVARRGAYTTPSATAQANRERPAPIVIESNGVDPIGGVCSTVVGKSRSNVRNN